MKNLYLGTLLLVVFALFPVQNIMAQVTSMEDLYGKYTLTYTINGSEKTTMEFSIEESDSKHYKKGMLTGFMGSTSPLYVNQFDADAHKFVIYSPSVNNVPLANANGDMPYAKDASDVNFELVVTYDPSTKSLSIPDMTLVDCNYSAWTATVLYRYSNISATRVGGGPEDVQVDWSGIYTVGPDAHDHNYGTGQYNYPESFTFTIIEDGGKYYITEFFGQNIEDITNGGILLQTSGYKAYIQNNQLVGKFGDGMCLYVCAPYGDVIELKKSGKNLTNSSYGISIKEGAEGTGQMVETYLYNTTTYTYTNAIVGSMDYCGTYNVSIEPELDMTDGAVPTKGSITIQKSDDKYVVTDFLGNRPFTMNYDLMYFTPDAKDPMKGTISSTLLKFIDTTADGGYTYWGLADMNLTMSPIPVTFDEEGNLHIEDFFIATYEYAPTFTLNGADVAAWYHGVVGVKEVAEKVVGITDITNLINDYLQEGSSVSITDITNLIETYLSQQ